MATNADSTLISTRFFNTSPHNERVQRRSSVRWSDLLGPQFFFHVAPPDPNQSSLRVAEGHRACPGARGLAKPIPYGSSRGVAVSTGVMRRAERTVACIHGAPPDPAFVSPAGHHGYYNRRQTDRGVKSCGPFCALFPKVSPQQFYSGEIYFSGKQGCDRRFPRLPSRSSTHGGDQFTGNIPTYRTKLLIHPRPVILKVQAAGSEVNGTAL